MQREPIDSPRGSEDIPELTCRSQGSRSLRLQRRSRSNGQQEHKQHATAPRFVLQWAVSGTEIQTNWSTRIDDWSTLSIGRIMAKLAGDIEWPVSHLSFCIGGRIYKADTSRPAHTTAERGRISDRDATPLLDLYIQHNSRDHQHMPLRIEVIRLRPPQDFREYEQGFCICDFPGQGCCHTGRTDDLHFSCKHWWAQLTDGFPRWPAWRCTSCGNNGCCQSGNCGHPCCEAAEAAYEAVAGEL